MNQKEKNIILEAYEQVFYVHYVLEFEHKEDSKREIKFLLDKLELKNDRYIIENKIISGEKNYNTIVRESFKMIYEDFKKYDCYINYNIDTIVEKFENLKFVMTDEEIKCNKARINLINNYLNQKVV